MTVIVGDIYRSPKIANGWAYAVDLGGTYVVWDFVRNADEIFDDNSREYNSRRLLMAFWRAGNKYAAAVYAVENPDDPKFVCAKAFSRRPRWEWGGWSDITRLTCPRLTYAGAFGALGWLLDGMGIGTGKLEVSRAVWEWEASLGRKLLRYNPPRRPVTGIAASLDALDWDGE
jgi:hypothetical protein